MKKKKNEEKEIKQFFKNTNTDYEFSYWFVVCVLKAVNK